MKPASPAPQQAGFIGLDPYARVRSRVHPNRRRELRVKAARVHKGMDALHVPKA